MWVSNGTVSDRGSKCCEDADSEGKLITKFSAASSKILALAALTQSSLEEGLLRELLLERF